MRTRLFLVILGLVDSPINAASKIYLPHGTHQHFASTMIRTTGPWKFTFANGVQKPENTVFNLQKGAGQLGLKDTCAFRFCSGPTECFLLSSFLYSIKSHFLPHFILDTTDCANTSIHKCSVDHRHTGTSVEHF